MNNDAFFKLSYGLFVLSAKQDDKDNGCIINTVMQVTDVPKKIVFTVNKQNLTHDMIAKTKVATISILDTSAPFSVFQDFGFKSGRDTDKFADINYASRAKNNVLYLNKYANSVICVKVTDMRDLGTHTEFLAEITEALVLSENPSMTYQYYFDNVKPKPKKSKGFVCKICGYVYEGDTLPSDYICPLCKHPASDFEPIN
ncbi:MAG: flavin reductase [Clostridia bacterium]|nr:flavin reductase [Clostridia bacterium]